MITTFIGIVSRGEGRGSTLGFSTANIPLQNKNISGIYAGKVAWHDSEYRAALFADPERGILEAYLLDFNEELYGEQVTMILMKKIREKEAFKSDTALQEHIKKDVEDVRAFFA